MIDFLVIGAGVAGLSAGARLSQHGTVTVLEAEHAIGFHASGRSAALFEEGYGPPSVVSLNRASKPYLASNKYLTPRGLMLVAKPSQTDLFRADLAELALDEISPSDAIDRVPVLDAKSVGHAAISDNAHDIDTDLMLQGFARAIRSNGGTVLTGQRVTEIRKASGWTVQTDRSFEARTLVNAAGAWSDEVATLAGLHPLGLSPCRRSMARIPAPGGHDVSSWPMMLGAGETWYAKPDAGKLLVSPCEADPVAPHDAYADDMVLAEGLARYEEMVTDPVRRVEVSWAGLRSFTPDGTLALGPDPSDPSFVWVAGQGGYGFQTAPAAGQLVADLVVGQPNELDPATIAALDPARFFR